MPSLVLSNRLIWFAHCPKSGGTSIEQYMVARWGEAVGHLHWGWDRWWHAGGWRVAAPPNSPQHLVWSDAAALLPKTPDVIFAVVRDPLQRMTSEYRWQRMGRRAPWLGKCLARLPFSFWLRVMLAVARHNPHAFDNHFRPQGEFVPDGARIFHLEDGLEQVVNWLSDTAQAPRTACGLPHAIPTRGGTSVTPRTAALIRERFAEDYQRFGYRFPPAEKTSAPVLDTLAAILARPIAQLERRGQL